MTTGNEITVDNQRNEIIVDNHHIAALTVNEKKLLELLLAWEIERDVIDHTND
jgi:hypothetical protein